MNKSQNIDKWISLEPQSTALLVIDMQVDFISPQGKAAKRGKKLFQMQSITGKVEDFAQKCTDMGLLVVYTKFVSGKAITPANLNIAVLKEGSDLPCIKGSGGEELYGLKVPPGAMLIEKPHYDAFAYTNLKKLLTNKSIKNILVTGVRTEICVDTTAKRAAAEGYNTIIVSDLVATYDDRIVRHNEVLDSFNNYYGFVIDSQGVIGLLSEAKHRKQ